MRKSKNLTGSSRAQLYMATTTLHDYTESFGCKSGFGICVSNNFNSLTLAIENLWRS